MKEIYYLKRWASLSVKILRYAESIKKTNNNEAQAYLRQQLNITCNIKNEEKTLFYGKLFSDNSGF